MTKGNRPEPSSDLWDLVLDMDWPRVVKHAKSEPQDADFLEGHWHETPLYLALQYDPPIEVIRAVIEAHPKSVQIASRENCDLSIHIACRYQADTAILEALLKDYPRTVMETTKWGLTPMKILWDFRATKTDHATMVPLNENYEFWNKVLVLLRAAERSHSMNIEHFDEMHRRNFDGLDSKISDIDNSLKLSPPLVAREEDRIFFVHAAVSLGAQGCPIEVLSYVMEKYPKQVFQRDARGHLPLHIAIQKVSWSKRKKRRLKPKEKPFLKCLLKAYPGSARKRIYSDHDRFPLHSALGNGHSWTRGIEDVFLAAPEVLLARDPFTRLFPFQLAGVPITEEKSSDVDVLETVYQLLRTQPDVIYYLQEAERRKKKPKPTHSTKDSRKRPSKQMLFIAFTKRLFGIIPVGTCHKSSVVDLFGTVVWDTSFLHLDVLFRLKNSLNKNKHKI